MRKGDYSQAKTLKEAIKICQQNLISDGKEEYIQLISEERVRSAIKTALESYKYILEKKVNLTVKIILGLRIKR